MPDRGTLPKADRIEDHSRLLELAIKTNSASQSAFDRLQPLFTTLSSVMVDGEGRKLAHSIKSRTKPTEDIIAKVARKRNGAEPESKNWSYDPTHVTDGCGWRIVVLFQQDILLVVEEIIKMLKHEKPYRDNPFIEDGLIEAVIYSNLPNAGQDSDGIPLKVTELLTKAGFNAAAQPPESRKGGYSSVHFVAKVEIMGAGKSQPSIPVEIQVRDIFEEAWCEIDHTLRYVNDREAPTEDIDATWKRHLAALKTAADGNSQHAALIKQTAIETLKRRRATGHTPLAPVPADEPGGVADQIARHLPPNFAEPLAIAFRTMAQAQEASDDSVRAALFKETAEGFDVILGALSQGVLSREIVGTRTIFYKLKMELAFCLQSSEVTDNIKRAVSIYQEIRTTWPDDAFATYRLAYLSRRQEIGRAHV